MNTEDHNETYFQQCKDLFNNQNKKGLICIAIDHQDPQDIALSIFKGSDPQLVIQLLADTAIVLRQHMEDINRGTTGLN